MVTLWAEAGAVKAPVEALIVPAEADQVMPVFEAPETELAKVVEPFTVMVGVTGLTAAMLTLWGVTVTEVVAVVPAALVTVRVKVRAMPWPQLAVMALVAAPEVTEPTLWSTAPFPAEKVPVRVKVEP